MNPIAKLTKSDLFYIAALVLLAVTGWMLAVTMDKAERMPAPVSAKVAALSDFYCPGMHAEWISPTVVQCLKETP